MPLDASLKRWLMSTPDKRLRLDSPVEEWARALSLGDRGVLARLLTFAESALGSHQDLVTQVLRTCSSRSTFRVGVTGAPGVGKSTLLEALGTRLLNEEKRVGVLSVDPSSQLTGGSILGDKARMVGLSRAPGAFVRSVPSGKLLGGMSPGIVLSLELMDRAGFDVVFVETVGVGQSEVEVSSLVDCVLLLLAPTMGDGLQGLKRGLMEHVDRIAVTRADRELQLAEQTLCQYLGALSILSPSRKVEGVAIDARSEAGCALLWQKLEALAGESRAERRKLCVNQWRERALWEEVSNRVKAKLSSGEETMSQAQQLIQEGCEGALSASSAAERLVRLLRIEAENSAN